MRAAARSITARPWSRTLLRSGLPCLTLALMAGAAALWASGLVPRMYRSQAVVSLSLPPDLGQLDEPALHRVMAELRSGAVEQLAGARARQVLAERHQLDANDQDALARRLNVRLGAGAEVSVSLTWPQERLASALPAEAAEGFIAWSRGPVATALTTLRKQWSQEADSCRQALAQLNLSVQRMASDSQVSPLISVTELDQQIAAARAALHAAGDELAQRRQQRAELPNPQSRTDALHARRRILENDLAVHRNQWGRPDDHPLVKRTLQQIAELDSQIAAGRQATDEGAAIARQQKQLDQQIAAAQARLDTAATSLDDLRRQRDRVEQVEQLESQRQQAQVALAQLEQKLSRVSAGADGGVDWITRVDTAGARAELLWPLPWHSAVAATGLAAMTFLVFLLLARRRDRTLYSVHHALDSLGLPLLGIVPPPQAPAVLDRRQALRLARQAPAALAAALFLAVSVHVNFTDGFQPAVQRVDRDATAAWSLPAAELPQPMLAAGPARRR